MKIDDRVTLNSGFSMPILGLGTWDLRHTTAEIVTYALQIGYRMIDTARDYGSQVGIGDALSTTEIAREEIFLVTKIEEDDEDPYAAAKIDLMKLRQPYSDLILIHRPPDNGISVELWQKLRQVRDEGLAKSIGVSNYSVEQLQELLLLTDEAPAVNQVEWSPFGYQPDMLRYCQANNIVV